MANENPSMSTASDDETGGLPPIKAAFNKNAPKPLSAGHIAAPNGRRVRMAGKRFVITSAQNNTEVNPGFVKALESYCQENDAQLLVTRFTYNKTAFQQKEDGTLWYDPRIEKYAFDQSAEITKKLILCGELDVSPSAGDPLSGFDSYCQGASGIIGHPKFAMKSLPGLGPDEARFMYTTGTCTQRNYIESKAGQKAEFHHNYGALVVEVDNDGDFFVRQICANNDGSFYDLTDKYLPSGEVLHDQRVEAVTLGDIHVEKTDPVSDKASFGKDGIMDTLRPKYAFLHDLIDFTSRNHHNRENPFFLTEQEQANASVEGDIDKAGAWLKKHERKDRKDIVVRANHDEAYERWMAEAKDVQKDSKNWEFWLESCLERVRQIKGKSPTVPMLEWAIRRKTDLPQVTFLTDSDSFVICKNDKEGGGIECGLHGHLGPNGARGTPSGFRSLAKKANTGHTHTAGIIDGVYTAGVSANLDMGYNKGPSSWSHSHIITYPNGKRAIITVKNGKWKADPEVKLSLAAASKPRREQRPSSAG
jgi:hypothetical protein